MPRDVRRDFVRAIPGEHVISPAHDDELGLGQQGGQTLTDRKRADLVHIAPQ